MSVTQIHDEDDNRVKINRDGSIPVSINGSLANDNGVSIGGFFPEPGVSLSDTSIGEQQSIKLDSNGNLCTRGPVTTDEGSFREDFSGTTIYLALTGTAVFTNGSDSVIGTGTTFTDGNLQYGDYIKLHADADTAYAQVQTIVSDTEITLTTAYSVTGSDTAGQIDRCKLRPIIGAGGSIGVASSICTIGSGTTINAKTEITREIDYGPLVMVAVASVSQRIANQSGYIGFVDNAVNPNISAWFVIDGTTNTTVKTITQFSSQATDIETNTVTLPGGANTGSANRYRIELAQEYCAFYINDILLATHKTHLPSPYAYMDGVVGWVNGGSAPASNSTITLDSFFCGNVDALQIMTGFGTLPMAMNNVQIGNQAINTGGVNGAQGMAGAIAHDSAGTASYPVKTGGRAVTANYTAVATGDVADFACTTVGAQIVKPFSIPEGDWQYGSSTAITNTTDVALKAAGAAGIRNYCTGIQIVNTSATATVVVVKDGSTVIWAGSAKQDVPVIVKFGTPLKGTAATALNFACLTTGSNTIVSAQGYQAP